MQTENLTISLDNRKIAIIALAIQMAFFGALSLDWIGLNIPFLQGVLGFVYLLTPGVILFCILNIHKQLKIESLLYIIGISVTLLMIIGATISVLYPLIGVQSPISTIPLVSTMTIIILILCFFLYRRRLTIQLPVSQFAPALSYKGLFLFLLPLIAVLGAYFVYFYNFNLLLLLLLVVLSLMALFTAFNRIPKSLYAPAIFSIALSLLYHYSLSSPYLFGRDVHLEYYQMNLVYINSQWYQGQGDEPALNSLLGNVILAPVFSKVTGINLIWVLKTIYPFLFALVPLALYQIFKKQTTGKIAFFSCFLFVSYFWFFTSSLQNIKQIASMFFLSLLILLMVDREINGIKKVFLSVIFGIGLATSHYGIPYFFLLSSIFVMFIKFLKERLGLFSPEKVRLATPNFVLLFATFTIAWYIFTGEGSGFHKIINLGNYIVSNISELFSPVEKGGIYYAITMKMPMLEYQILRIFYYVINFLIVIGLLSVFSQKMRKKEEHKFQSEFFFFSVASFIWLVLAVIFPIYAGAHSLGTTRLYILTLLFLAPFSIVGGEELSMWIQKFFYKFGSTLSANYLKIIAIFLTIFLLLNTELIMEMHREVSGGEGYGVSLALSGPRIREGKCTPEEMSSFYSSISTEYDVYGTKWLGKHRSQERKVVLDYSLVAVSSGMIPSSQVVESTTTLQPYLDNPSKEAYVFLRKVNRVDGLLVGRGRKWWNSTEILPILEVERNKVYANGGSVVYE